jgi:hypothetical protein
MGRKIMGRKIMGRKIIVRNRTTCRSIPEALIEIDKLLIFSLRA